MNCTHCSARAAHSLGTLELCETHYNDILAPIRARVMTNESGVGHGCRIGPLLADWGHDWALLTCSLCDAEWVGPIGEECGWCSARVDSAPADHARVVLRADLPDADDSGYDGAVAAWAARLAVAVAAGVVDEVAARAAIERELRVRQ